MIGMYQCIGKVEKLLTYLSDAHAQLPSDKIN